MQQNWIQDLKDKMSDFEMEVPEGLSFESVGKAMADRKGMDERRVALFPWRKLAVAASVAVVLASGVSLLYLDDDSRQLPAQVSVATASALPSGMNVRPAQLPEPVEPVVQVALDVAVDESSGVTRTPVCPESLTEPAADTPAVADDGSAVRGSDVADRKSDWFLASEIENRSGCVSAAVNRKYLALGVSVSATGLGDASGTKGYRPSAGGPIWLSDASGADGMSTRMGGLKLEGESDDPEVCKDMFEHKLPIGFGLDLSWRLNRHFALQAGVSYTLLRSDIRYGGSSPFTRGDATQHLHYVGLPVSVRYIPFEFRNFSVYLSAGATVEKCVAADVSSRTAYGAPYSYRGLGDRPFQFSVNAGVGVEYAFSSLCGFYVQPSVGYYPDDGSLLRTIYKEHPLTVNLNLGFRFSLH